MIFTDGAENIPLVTVGHSRGNQGSGVGVGGAGDGDGGRLYQMESVDAD